MVAVALTAGIDLKAVVGKLSGGGGLLSAA